MGIIGRIIRTLIEDNIREIVIEEYQGLTKKLRQVSPAGIDSNPLPEDQGAGYYVGGTTGKPVSIGVLCENNIAENGELRLFARDDSAVEKTFVYLKKDGTLELNGNADNAIRYSKYDEDIQSLITQINTNLGLIATAITNLSGTYVSVPLLRVTLPTKVLEVKLP